MYNYTAATRLFLADTKEGHVVAQRTLGFYYDTGPEGANLKGKEADRDFN